MLKGGTWGRLKPYDPVQFIDNLYFQGNKGNSSLQWHISIFGVLKIFTRSHLRDSRPIFHQQILFGRIQPPCRCQTLRLFFFFSIMNLFFMCVPISRAIAKWFFLGAIPLSQNVLFAGMQIDYVPPDPSR